MRVWVVVRQRYDWGDSEFIEVLGAFSDEATANEFAGYHERDYRKPDVVPMTVDEQRKNMRSLKAEYQERKREEQAEAQRARKQHLDLMFSRLSDEERAELAARLKEDG